MSDSWKMLKKKKKKEKWKKIKRQGKKYKTFPCLVIHGKLR